MQLKYLSITLYSRLPLQVQILGPCDSPLMGQYPLHPRPWKLGSYHSGQRSTCFRWAVKYRDIKVQGQACTNAEHRKTPPKQA